MVHLTSFGGQSSCATSNYAKSGAATVTSAQQVFQTIRHCCVLQEDYSELRQSYEALRAEHTASETKAQIGVSNHPMHVHNWHMQLCSRSTASPCT